MKYAIIGGSFDPFHAGHLSIADAVLQNHIADRCIFVPTFQSPFKLQQGAPSSARVQMLLAAISADRRFTVDTCEVDRGGISYTIDTLRDITKRYGRCVLVIGDDLCAEFHEWRDAAEIAQISDICIAARSSPAPFIPYPHTLIHNGIVQVSSSELRELILKGGMWEQLVPPPVAQIIKSAGYYGYVKCGDNLGAAQVEVNHIQGIENSIRSILDEKRFIHSRNTALHCADIAEHFNIDAERAYIAGITHDACKRFSDDQMIQMAKKDGLPINKYEKEKPALLHGRAAAIFIQEEFGIDKNNDADIIEAVRYHTSGIENMCDIAKIVYICDKIEIGRKTVDQNLREIAFNYNKEHNSTEYNSTEHNSKEYSLDEIFEIVLNATNKYLEESGHVVYGLGCRMDGHKN